MEYPIPEHSLNRIRQQYASFEQLTAVIAEALGIDVSKPYRLDIQGGKFVVENQAEANGIVEATDLAVVSDPAF